MRAEHWLYHPVFQDDCGECWAEMQWEVRAQGPQGRVYDWPFTCARCGKRNCADGGQYRSRMLCFACYKAIHRYHIRRMTGCWLCKEDPDRRF